MEHSGISCISRTPSRFSARAIVLSLMALTGLLASSATSRAATPAGSQDDAAAQLSRSFRCPEDYSSDSEKKAALHEFMQAYAARFPNNNARDLLLFRYRLLVTHSCVQALNSMLADVGPISEMLHLDNQDFGPKTEEYDPKTTVWTVWFRKDGQTPALSESDLIFNFYGWPGPSPESIATTFITPRPNVNILWKFEAPDNLTKKPAYIIVSETLYTDENYGYVNITKITSAGSGTYAVTLAKKIWGGATAQIADKGKTWFVSEEGQETSRTVGNIGVDASWEQYFARKPK